MTVVLEFVGGPKDGSYKRVLSKACLDSSMHTFKTEFGFYLSKQKHKQGETRISMTYFYGGNSALPEARLLGIDRKEKP